MDFLFPQAVFIEALSGVKFRLFLFKNSIQPLPRQVMLAPESTKPTTYSFTIFTLRNTLSSVESFKIVESISLKSLFLALALARILGIFFKEISFELLKISSRFL